MYNDSEFRISNFPRTPDPPKPEPGLGDDIACVKCGSVALDTGLECDACGFDNYEAVYGHPFGTRPAEIFVEINADLG